MTRSLLVCDIDGTLFDTNACDMDDPLALLAACRAHKDACRAVATVRDLGTHVAYLTGRSEKVREITTRQLWAAGLPHGALVMQQRFTTYDAMALFKAGELRRWAREYASVHFIGDHDADRQAARAAQVPFIDAEDWRHHGAALIDPIGSRARRATA